MRTVDATLAALQAIVGGPLQSSRLAYRISNDQWSFIDCEDLVGVCNEHGRLEKQPANRWGFFGTFFVARRGYGAYQSLTMRDREAIEAFLAKGQQRPVSAFYADPESPLIPVVRRALESMPQARGLLCIVFDPPSEAIATTKLLFLASEGHMLSTDLLVTALRRHADMLEAEVAARAAGAQSDSRGGGGRAGE